MSNALRIAYGTFGRVALLDMDRSLVRHAHPHCHVLLKVEGADTRFTVGDEVVALTDDQAVLVNAWAPHAYVHDRTRPRTIILALYIEPQWLRTFRSNWGAASAAKFFDRPAGAMSPRLRRLAMDLATVMMADPGANAAQEQLLSDLMIAVIERFTLWRSTVSFVRDTGGIDWRIRRAVDILRANPELHCDVTTLAREAGLSRAHFYRLFERSTRVTPHVYLNVLRMELAVGAVVNEQHSIAAVSDRLGFAAPSHFTRFFRDHAGVKPSEFRSVARMGTAG
ncbi:helix-turn-helix transcriptional regulator [Rhodoplanes roseus]|uniref:AraC family transcriptional regulator n=1 Tax=Rhodoplanes roseus TaxID=29409 RepID=A0A327L3J8_9BRAD|nr:AraC family transcriptional regulator [Rhodoplanes roseus]RAI45101.1 AraC family transcriptional regulator [Rhodoplanes roseus]